MTECPIGDDAIGMALRAVAESEAALHRRPGVPRLEHVVLARPEHLRAAGDLGVAAVVQPGFVHHHGDDLLATPLPEPSGMLPLRDMLDAGVVLAGSSDYPVTPPSVMAAIAGNSVRGRDLDPRQLRRPRSLLLWSGTGRSFCTSTHFAQCAIRRRGCLRWRGSGEAVFSLFAGRGG